MKVVVGIDVSKDWFDIAWKENDRIKTQRFDSTASGINQLMKATPADAIYVMEATGVYHARLAVTLFETERNVAVINPLVIKRYGQMRLSRVKTDTADASLILSYGESVEFMLWKPEPHHIQELKVAQGWLDDLTEDMTRLSNRGHAQSYLVVRSAMVDRQFLRRKEQLKQDITECEAHLEKQVKKHFAELYKLLNSIPSIGSKTATQLIISTGGFTKFISIKQLSAYVGVSPTTYESGSSVRGRGGIAKMGQGRLRQLLYLCSWTARKCNPSCVALYERLQAFAVATKKTAYSPEFA
ncbi:hypothetical protein CBP31_15345 [Oceanisphaera profunda]|uniref:Uncharacterized protein n=1 Tax=Oceanisphaera profunda TaxID=1416627 RepID=A0A1Y0D8E1_9GAMM|nr:IS110 family transposase [Oceanisphaera profunda]ART83840.1 hypothetical protein CBP31_15345 [Oceanisphaera profunda]